MEITSLAQRHWPDVKRIYEEGIATGLATFQTESPGWEEWDQKHHVHSRLVAMYGGEVLGWVALSPVSTRAVYAGVAEVSLYVTKAARGKGIGKALLQAVITSSEANNIWTLQSGIFADNIPSIRLHEICGFRLVGLRERIGRLNGVWKDNVLMERRSRRIGI